jgi:acetyl-CoA synthetase
MGVRKGDPVCIYMPMVPEAAIAMLACTRIGAPHSVVFAGFSAESLRGRIVDGQCRFVLTADEGMRAGRPIALKQITDNAIVGLDVQSVLVYRRTGAPVSMQEGRDIWWHEALDAQRPYCPPEWMDAEDMLFMLYTSGSTGKPKGIAHTTAGYLLYATMTHKYVFDVHENDVYACMAVHIHSFCWCFLFSSSLVLLSRRILAG